MIDITPGMKICDPACGVGKFLLEPILHDLHRFYKVEDGELLADTINTLSELDEPLAEVEKKNDEGLQFLEIPITQVFDIVRGDGKYTRS